MNQLKNQHHDLGLSSRNNKRHMHSSIRDDFVFHSKTMLDSELNS
jgi:hypothetical protein